MKLLPQDVVVLLKLIAYKGSKNPTYAKLSADLFMSPSQVFRSVRRAENSHLLHVPSNLTAAAAPGNPVDDRRVVLWANQNSLKEFLIHGVKYAFPAERGGPTRGVPTAEAAPPLAEHFLQDASLGPVWPFAEGQFRGLAFSPLSENVPRAALRDPRLYELLALLDAIREGRAREREIAIRELNARIDSK